MLLVLFLLVWFVLLQLHVHLFRRRTARLVALLRNLACAVVLAPFVFVLRRLPRPWIHDDRPETRATYDFSPSEVDVDIAEMELETEPGFFGILVLIPWAVLTALETAALFSLLR